MGILAFSDRAGLRSWVTMSRLVDAAAQEVRAELVARRSRVVIDPRGPRRNL